MTVELTSAEVHLIKFLLECFVRGFVNHDSVDAQGLFDKLTEPVTDF